MFCCVSLFSIFFIFSFFPVCFFSFVFFTFFPTPGALPTLADIMRFFDTLLPVDIPVPGGGGRHADLQGFLRGQSSTALHVSEERISERIMEQVVDFPVSVEGIQDFRTGQSSSSSSHVPSGVHEARDEPGKGFISHFSPK